MADSQGEQPEKEEGEASLSARDAAEFLGVSTGRLEQLRRQRAIRAQKAGWGRYRYHPRDLMACAEQAAKQAASIPDPAKEENTGPDSDDSPPIVHLVNAILVSGLDAFASEIRLEPNKRQTRVRIRVAGVLEELMTTPRHIETALLNRLMIMAGLNPFSLHPQLGTIPVSHGGEDINLRTVAMPSYPGRSLTLRVFRRRDAISGIHSAGLYADVQMVLEEGIAHTGGMMLFVGTPGMGATTTAFRCLNKMNTVGRAIATFEETPGYALSRV